jgi:hypothetical protein
MKTSGYLKINFHDLAKGATVATGTVMLSLLGTMMESGMNVTDEQLIMSVKMGVLAAVSYLIKNLFTNSDDQMFKSESN